MLNSGLDPFTPTGAVAGYSLEADVALINGEIHSRANNTSSVLRRNREWVEKGIMDFHAILAVPKTEKHPHPKFPLPGIGGFAKDRVEILQDAMRKTFKDPEFRTEFQKLVTDEISPLTPEELAKTIREMPRDPEVVEMLKKFSGVDRLPWRRTMHGQEARRDPSSI